MISRSAPHAAVLAVLVTALAAAQDRYGRPDSFEASVRTLGEAVRLPPTGARNPSLIALIEMRDPELKPLFQTLLQRPDRPVMQADAIVGMGLIDPRGTVDPFILRQIPSDELRSEVLKSLIGRDLLKAPEINQILSWPDQLLPEDRLFLVATLQRQKEPWQPDALDAIAESQQPAFRALAALLLLEQNQPEAWERFRASSLALMTPEARTELLEALAPAIRTYGLTRAVGPLLRVAADRDIDANVRAAVIGSALELDPESGVAALRDEVQQDRTPVNLLRYALLLLVVSDQPGIDRDAFAIFDDIDLPEVRAFAAAGRCADCGPGCGERYTRVINMGLRPAAEWCLQQAAACSDPAITGEVMNFVLDLAAQARDPREPILILAVRAARELIRVAPDDLLRRITDPASPAPVVESIMLALIDAASDDAAALASRARGKLPRRFDSMALVAIARSGQPLTKADIDQLGVIAAGGGRVDAPLQAQAAWLHLKALARQRDALARLALD